MFKDLKTGTTYKIAIPVKQFTIETAYVGNTMVRLYENGIFQEERIIADYALSEMINYLTNHGYALVNDYQKALFEYNEAYDFYFGFRRDGVDHNEFIESRLRQDISYEYRSIWRLSVHYDTERIYMRLKRLR